MDPSFWHERWQRGETGFHQPRGNPQLQRHWPAAGVAAAATVLVPLCGKSRDMDWLLARGHRVLGVELSSLAAEAWFEAAGLVPRRTGDGPFQRLEAGGCAILVGDCFALGAAQVAGVGALYDRAALVALPAALRERYAALLAALLPAGTPGLLLTMDYPQEQMAGPPFSVPADEVHRLLGTAFAPRLLERVDALAGEPRLAARGLRSLHEEVWALRRA